jgi:hypothetical protein
MKRIIVLIGACMMAGGIVAQPTVRIGNMEISVKKINGDTMTQILVDEPKPKQFPKHEHVGYFGLGMNYPGNSDDIYPLAGSFNLDVGGSEIFRLSRHFALVGSLGYSFYNYRLRNVVGADAEFDEITDGRIDADRIKRQMFRSNDLATGIYTRFYLITPRWNGLNSSTSDRGVYIDLGVQGDWAFAKYVKIKYNKGGGSEKFHDNYAFKPFNASAVVRVGWSNVAFFGRYRFTDTFNHNVLSGEVPRWSFGVLFD